MKITPEDCQNRILTPEEIKQLGKEIAQEAKEMRERGEVPKSITVEEAKALGYPEAWAVIHFKS